MARAVVRERSSASDRCPRCDGEVGCAIATGACWCAGVTLPAQRQRELAERYDGCLCPACLRELAAQAPA